MIALGLTLLLARDAAVDLRARHKQRKLKKKVKSGEISFGEYERLRDPSPAREYRTYSTRTSTSGGDGARSSRRGGDRLSRSLGPSGGAETSSLRRSNSVVEWGKRTMRRRVSLPAIRSLLAGGGDGAADARDDGPLGLYDPQTQRAIAQTMNHNQRVAHCHNLSELEYGRGPRAVPVRRDSGTPPPPYEPRPIDAEALDGLYYDSRNRVRVGYYDSATRRAEQPLPEIPAVDPEETDAMSNAATRVYITHSYGRAGLSPVIEEAHGETLDDDESVF